MDDDELVAELNRKAEAAEAQAQQLLRKADAYRTAAGELLGGIPATSAEPELRSLEATQPKLKQAAPTNGVPPRLSWATPRMLEIDEFLRTHGPSTKGEIANGSGVPGGTLRAVLNRTYFERDEHGQRWVRLRDVPLNQNHN